MTTNPTYEADKLTPEQVLEIARYGFIPWAIECAAELNLFWSSDYTAVVCECKRRVL